jgi:hypothetical protein
MWGGTGQSLLRAEKALRRQYIAHGGCFPWTSRKMSERSKPSSDVNEFEADWNALFQKFHSLPTARQKVLIIQEAREGNAPAPVLDDLPAQSWLEDAFYTREGSNPELAETMMWLRTQLCGMSTINFACTLGSDLWEDCSRIASSKFSDESFDVFRTTDRRGVVGSVFLKQSLSNRQSTVSVSSVPRKLCLPLFNRRMLTKHPDRLIPPSMSGTQKKTNK